MILFSWELANSFFCALTIIAIAVRHNNVIGCFI
jgi:hypothetical protein